MAMSYVVHSYGKAFCMISPFFQQANYRIAGFVCEVLNHASCHELANFNSAVSYSCIFVSAYCTRYSSVLVISLSYVSVQVLQKSDLLPTPKSQRIAMVVCIMCTMTFAALLQCNLPKHP